MTGIQFTDVEYMTADDKQKLVRAWTTFVKHGFQWSHFSDRIYKHLSLHVGHIAHFDRGGFWQTWFKDGEDRLAFIDHFLSYRVMDDYFDVHTAMKAVLNDHIENLSRKAVEDEISKLTLMRNNIDSRLTALKGQA